MEGQASEEYQCRLVEAVKQLWALRSRRDGGRKVEHGEQKEGVDTLGTCLALGNHVETDREGVKAVVTDGHKLQETHVL